MAQFEAVDLDGNRSGRIFSRAEELPDGFYIPGVHVYIHDEQGCFLMQRRALTKSIRPGEWTTTMGHVEIGESADACALRETMEEVGLCAKPDALRWVGRFIYETIQYSIDVFLLAHPFTMDQVTMQPEEVMQVKLLTREELCRFLRDTEGSHTVYRDALLNALSTLRACAGPPGIRWGNTPS